MALTMIKTKGSISRERLLQAYRMMAIAKAMTDIYEANFKAVSKYVHATSRGHEAIHQRLLAAELMGIAHGATHDAAKHVAAPLVGGQHAIGDEKTRCAQMIRDDATRGRHVDILARFRGANLLGLLADGRNEIFKQIDFVIVVLALKHRRYTLQPHPCVN